MRGRWQRHNSPNGVRVRFPPSERFDDKQLDIEAQRLRKKPIAATRSEAERAADEARVKAIRWRQEQADLRLQRNIEQRRTARHMTR